MRINPHLQTCLTNTTRRAPARTIATQIHQRMATLPTNLTAESMFLIDRHGHRVRRRRNQETPYVAISLAFECATDDWVRNAGQRRSSSWYSRRHRGFDRGCAGGSRSCCGRTVMAGVRSAQSPIALSIHFAAWVHPRHFRFCSLDHNFWAFRNEVSQASLPCCLLRS